MTLHDMEKRIDVLAEEMASIRAKVEKAKAGFRATGQYADPVWFAKAKAALRFKGVEHQQLQREAGRLRAIERAATAVRTETAFIDIAREQLPAETFHRIMGDAIARAGVA